MIRTINIPILLNNIENKKIQDNKSNWSAHMLFFGRTSVTK